MTPAQFASEMSQLGQNVSRETFSRLETYDALLRKWQAKINLVAKDSLQDLWRRHFLDSAQLLPLLPPGHDPITDLGSGAGFPGLVLAIMTERQVHLVDSDQRKGAFLIECARQAGVLDRVKVHTTRIEAADAWKAPIITARALAALDQLLAWAEPFMTQETVCLFLKGAKVEDELTLASRSWNMAVTRHGSLTDPSGIILKLSNIERRGQN
ncbi:16S rRNA (guanine(527)-N(7))-methyltransferase RsmG [Dongia sp.]|uniref:16S rRNA (guanine(527)-N(7))-methyltransferase RsmG n=1 Tax=Dongia sp. TaxID=1977262 RepID=UPI0035B17A2C